MHCYPVSEKIGRKLEGGILYLYFCHSTLRSLPCRDVGQIPWLARAEAKHRRDDNSDFSSNGWRHCGATFGFPPYMDVYESDVDVHIIQVALVPRSTSASVTTNSKMCRATSVPHRSRPRVSPAADSRILAVALSDILSHMSMSLHALKPKAPLATRSLSVPEKRNQQWKLKEMSPK